MLLLAAKIALLSSVSGQLAPAESATWTKLRNSVAVLTRNGEAVGPAVFISSEGYAVANSSLIQKGPSDLITSAGLTYKFVVEATDSASQLCLIKTSVKPAGITIVRASDASDGISGAILAVTPSGVLRAELTGGEKFGVDQRTKRTFPIQEVRVEQRSLQMGGTLIFSKNGNLIGALFAALAQDTLNSQQQAFAKTTQDYNLQLNSQLNNRNYGPQGMVVAYTPAWEVTSKAITGFLSPDKKAQYGLLGIFVIENKSGGVEITSIQKGTGAETAGLQVADIVIGIDGVPIRNQIDFSRAIYRLTPGSIASVSYQRKGVTNSVMVTVGTQLAELDEHRQSSTGSIDSLGIR